VIEFNTDSWKETAAKIAVKGPRIFQRAKEAALKTGFRIEADAKNNVPVDTGGLRASITTVEMTGSTASTGAYGMTSAGKNEYTVKVGPNKHYGAYVEFGTRPHCPPFDAILDWVKRKGLGSTVTRSTNVGGAFGANRVKNRTTRARGRSIDIEQARIAYLIMRKIQQRGTRPHPYMMPSFVRRMEEFSTAMAGIIADEVRKG